MIFNRIKIGCFLEHVRNIERTMNLDLFRNLDVFGSTSEILKKFGTAGKSTSKIIKLRNLRKPSRPEKPLLY